MDLTNTDHFVHRVDPIKPRSLLFPAFSLTVPRVQLQACASGTYAGRFGCIPALIACLDFGV